MTDERPRFGQEDRLIGDEAWFANQKMHAAINHCPCPDYIKLDIIKSLLTEFVVRESAKLNADELQICQDSIIADIRFRFAYIRDMAKDEKVLPE